MTVTVQSPAGTERLHYWTLHQTVLGALRQAGLQLGPHDAVTPGLKARLARWKSAITIRRATELVVDTPHRHLRVWTRRFTVRGLLDSLHIRLGPLDQVHPGLNASLAAQHSVTVVRRWIMTQTASATLPFAVNYQPDPQLYKGQRQIVQAGRNGVVETVTRTLVADGKPVRLVQKSTRVVRPQTPEVVAYGTKPLVSRSGEVFSVSRVLTMVATAYWPNPAWSDGYTATGVPARYGVVAVDPSVIPLGTRLYIPGYGFATAADTGGAIRGDRIDLCMNNATQAQDFGVQTIRVFVLQ